MKAIMYHYVREASPDLPNFIYLDYQDFQKQIDFFLEKYHILSREEFYNCLKTKTVIENGVVLTFDDGLKDHYEYVYQYLKLKGVWGLFFISTLPFISKNLLDVHRTHYLLGKFQAHELVEYVNSIISSDDLIYQADKKFLETTYTDQKSEESVKEFKRIINYYLRPGNKSIILDKVIKEFSDIPEEEIARDYYLSKEQISEMKDYGMEFGCHAHSHSLLSNLSDANLSYELNISNRYLKELLQFENINGFCFPYGGKQSYDQRVLKKITEQNYEYGFTVESRNITPKDILEKKFELPRYDCNEFPYGQATFGIKGK